MPPDPVKPRDYAHWMERPDLVRRALALSVASVALSGALGGLAIVVGTVTGRLSLLGFGLDAAIDAVASIVLVWRFRIEARDPHRAERAERAAERVVGAVLIVLAVYLAITAGNALLTGARPHSETLGLAISLVSLALLPALALAKHRVARALGSRALRADSILTGVAAVLALLSVIGFVLTETFRVTWADPLAALVIAVVLVREGAAAFRTQGLESY